ncbi:MAG: hypothetical protein Q6364_06150 [Candidatus Hermodarchaeota archaeon]|nr:hypothetical protein [Candidatus Hermodarchaeota archaeon]
MKKRTRAWIWVIVPTLILIIGLGWFVIYLGFGRNCGFYPAEFTYFEHRIFNTPEEANALHQAETFNYTQIPANTSYLEHSGFITQTRRDALNITAYEFDPYANCGYFRYNYTASANWYANLTVNIDAWEYYPEQNPLLIKANESILFPINLPDWPIYYWLGGFWNDTHYEDFNQEQSFNYTNVYLIDMQLSFTYYCGPLCAGSQLECQQIIIDETEHILFAAWIWLMGPVA